MPALTQISLDNFLHPSRRDGDSQQNSLNLGKKCDVAQTRTRMYIPALYVTPAPIRISESLSDPPSPSPYVVNHKGRGGGRFKEIVRVEGEDGEDCSNLNPSGDSENGGEEVVDNGEESGENGRCYGGDLLCESMSVVSSVDDLGKQGEFFDSNEVLSSDGSISNISSSYGQRIGSELCAVKLSLFEEIERRKTAEYAVSQMHNQWQRLASRISETGLTFPAPPNASTMQLEMDSLEQCCQELAVTRFVAEAVGRGLARAEAEVIIESKDQEISRLRDRLQYSEAVNREMSQRNQENMEASRMQQQREKKQLWRWMWSCVGVSVTVGASLFAYSYFLETGKHHSLPSPSDSSDASYITTTKSA